MANFVGNKDLVSYTIRMGRVRATTRGAGRNMAEIIKKRRFSVIKALPVEPELFELGDKVMERCNNHGVEVNKTNKRKNCKSPK